MFRLKISTRSGRVRIAFAITLATVAVLGTAFLVLAAPKQRIAVFHPSTADWTIRQEDGTQLGIRFGGAGDVPVPADYDGHGRAQLAVYRPGSSQTPLSQWFIRADDGSAPPITFGQAGDQPIPADYLGQGHAQIAVYRPSTNQWFIQGASATTTFGGAGDVPVPADYLGQGHVQIAIFRPTTGQWFISGSNNSAPPPVLGQPGDVPVPGDYAGVKHAQIAVFHPGADQTPAQWIVLNDDGTKSQVTFGIAGDVPVPGDYDGTGKMRRAVYRPGTSQWLVQGDDGNATPLAWGVPGDVPAAAPYFPAAATTPPLSLDKDIQPIFTANCATFGCHAGSFPQEGQDLSAGKAYNNIVNVNSAEVPSKKRVKPGDPANSFLFEKISTDRPSVGSRMPSGQPPLSAANIEKIRQWIAQGANR